MPRKSKPVEEVEQPKQTFQPYTYIRCLRASLWDGSNLHKGSTYLFMGWITNPYVCGDNAVLADDRGVFTAEIREEDFEVCK